MKLIIKSLLLFQILILVSCNSLGEDLVELPLKSDNITSTKAIDLKQGETIAIWTKFDTDTPNPQYSIKYLIEESGTQIKFDSLSFNSAEKTHIINATASNEELIEKTFDEKDTIIYKENFKFELENYKFIAPKDGKYTFDFKLTTQTESSFYRDYTIVLRK